MDVVIVSERRKIEALEQILVNVGGCGSNILVFGILCQNTLEARLCNKLLIYQILVQDRSVFLLTRLLSLGDLFFLLVFVRGRHHRWLLVVRGGPLSRFHGRVFVRLLIVKYLVDHFQIWNVDRKVLFFRQRGVREVRLNSGPHHPGPRGHLPRDLRPCVLHSISLVSLRLTRYKSWVVLIRRLKLVYLHGWYIPELDRWVAHTRHQRVLFFLTEHLWRVVQLMVYLKMVVNRRLLFENLS